MLPPLTRREVIAGVAATLVLGCRRGAEVARRDSAGPVASAPRASSAVVADAGPPRSPEPIRRRIPSTGELIPAIGLGSWQTFDVPPAEVPAMLPVITRFLALGGRVIDSSPMYGRAEAAIGEMLAAARAADPSTPAPFLATKVWTEGARAGEAEMQRSLERLGVTTLDLMQIHNLLDWQAHLPALRAHKAAGRFRYLGVTHYQHGAFDELERIVRRERIDFVQLPYLVSDRAAERRLLPAAADAGVAVLVMQPFDSGALFAQVRGKPLPPVAAELGCTSWAQLFLKWLLGHPAVTCPIPATSRVAHLEDNLGARVGAVPDEAQRAAIVRAVEG